jgi:ferrochelatase
LERPVKPAVQTGVLVMNIGTPKSPSREDVTYYLRRFLGDDRVLDFKPALVKALLLEFLLLFRSPTSAKNYSEIWSEKGSPLQFITDDLVARLQLELGDNFVVRCGMRYSAPYIEDAMKSFAEEGISNVVLVPNYPQYASSTTGSSLQAAFSAASQSYVVPSVGVVPPFYSSEGFIDAWAAQIMPYLTQIDHLVLSFHGVPEKDSDPYFTQAMDTARGIAKKLDLPDKFYSVAFQSRLTLRDRIKWVEPYTDVRLIELAQEGKKKVGICAPSFTIDCLETLHELGVEAREDVEEQGGELVLIPCLNDDTTWVSSLSDLVRAAAPAP